MQGGDKVGSVIPIYLPSINSLPKKQVVLPSISSLNKLTESNLNHFNSYNQYTVHHPITPPSSNTNSRPNSLSSVPSSPKSDLDSKEDVKIKEDGKEAEAKRRQRLGPSCDNCRVRKVKCNAEIVILSSDYKSVNLSDFNLGLEDVAFLNEGKAIKLVEEWWLIISNEKLIKFKACKSCNNKNLDCKFSKGFTKEDILINKKNLKFKIDKKKIDNSRKSSCSNCRKRKIKCSVNSDTDKCDNCFKRNSQCNFN
jgi:hypothetical protein